MSSLHFRQKIRVAIADPQLQAALDANAKRRGAGRATAFESLPDWRERRRRAHTVRAEVIQNLPDMLRRFSENAMRHGMQVHQAKDAGEAVQLVLDIAEAARADDRERAGGNALLFAKSKSMVSEEIELNAELERQGHRVVETDLGEYIVQLRNEKPAHIITPAVHLLRGQVAALFEEKLGLPYTEDIGALTSAARAALREVFLAADVGISGVNFGVVETGGICIVTNEGNGRMVTTVPRVHIALMGMERLVPTLDDLALMLSLLPRSATGQKLSVYTQLIHGPRAEGEVDGAIQRHVIILDNGRIRMWESGLHEALYCIRCGACLNACPVFREVGGHAYVDDKGAPAPYPGPIGSIVSPGLQGLARFGHLAQASSLCGACKDACPVDIDLPRMLTRVRAGAPEGPTASRGIALSPIVRFALQAYTWIAVKPRLFGSAQRAAALGARLLAPRSAMLRMPALTGWGYSKDLPKPAKRAFRNRWRDLRALDDGASERMGAGTGSPPNTRGDEVRRWEPVARVEHALIPRLTLELESLGARVEVLEPAALPARILELLRARGIQRVAAWESVEGLSMEALRDGGLELVSVPQPEVRAGITGCACAVAETGTIVTTSGTGKPLTASLLPEVHIAVVPRVKVVATLEEAIGHGEIRESTSSVLVTGPSRTADIEMTLTIGVHGPKELLVFVTG